VLRGTNGNGATRRPAAWYACSYNHNRGRVVCANDHRAPMAHLDRAVIAAIKEQVLLPEGIAYTMAQAAALVEQQLKQNPDKPKQLEAEARQLRREIERYVAAVATAEDVPELLLALKQRKERLAEVESRQAAAVSRLPVWTPAEIRAMCGEQLNLLEQLLLGDMLGARRALRTLLPERLRLTPATAHGRRTLRFEGVTALGPFLQKAWRPHGDSNPGYRRERAMS
jgi:site-specific DNA recombinase